jgi:hypothetical protein
MLPEFTPKARAKINLPPPSGYRQLVPAFQPPTLAPDAQRRERSRLLLWFGVALGLHAALLLALFLTPPLRLKASYAPDRWVHIMPIPAVSSLPAPIASPPAPRAKKPTTSDRDSAKTKPQASQRQE